MKTIGIIGSGIVGQTLADGFLKHGHKVMIGTRDTSKLKDWQAKNGSNAHLGSSEETANFGDILVLATKGTVAEDVVASLPKTGIENKTIIDATNPITDEAPEDGVIKFFTKEKSLIEILQEAAPNANFVKAFNTIGSGFMVNPKFESKPTMFIAGNNENSKQEAGEIIEKFRFEVEDMGTAKAGNVLEQLCILWCIPGFRENRWNHAFKLMKAE